ncbi:LTA synthase family protein [Pediococcus sp. M21F004]|uniref:LTA synthase family protein n=1 Tax=Pediococcus sp. M21F004 TaxID=3390033 RepID=UPI003DA70CC7
MIFSKITKKNLVLGLISIFFLVVSVMSKLLLNVNMSSANDMLKEVLKFGSLFGNVGVIGIVCVLGASIEYRKASIKGVLKLLIEILAYTIPTAALIFALSVQSIQKSALIRSFFPFATKNYWIVAVILFGSILLVGAHQLNGKINQRIVIWIFSTLGIIAVLFSAFLASRNLILMIIWSFLIFLGSSYIANENYKSSKSYVLLPLFIIVLAITLIMTWKHPDNQGLHAALIAITVATLLSYQLLPDMAKPLKDLNGLIFTRILLGLSLIFLNPLILGILTKYTLLQVSNLTTIYSLLEFYLITLIVILVIVVVESLGVAKEYLGIKNMQITLPIAICVIAISYLIYNGSQFLDSGLVALQNSQGNSLYLELLNLIIIALLYLFVQGIFNRFWYSNFLFIMLMMILSYANYAKLIARDEPIIRPDFGMIKSLPDIVQMVNLEVVYGLIAALIVVIILSVVLQHFVLKGPMFHWPVRIGVLLLSTLLLFAFAQTENKMNLISWEDKKVTNSSPLMSALSNAGFSAHPGALEMSTKKYGPAITFMSTVIIKTMNEPSGYSQASVNEVVKKYKKVARKINQNRVNKSLKKQTVIYVLSESYADPRMMPTVKLSKNPIPYEQSVEKENTSGLMDSPSYGGGTANIEFEALTGLSMNNFDPSMVTPYVFLVPKVDNLPVITDYFKTKTAIHPYSGVTYNRTNVFKKFGFQRFYSFTGNKLTYTGKLGKSPYVSDDSAYRQLLKQINATSKGQFIQLATMQNHMPFHLGTYNKNDFKATGNLTKSSLEAIESYSQGLNYTDNDLKMLINKVSKMKKHVTIVWYGDHLPGLYEGPLVNGKNLAKYDNKLHQTNYFIYSNFKHQKLNHTKVVSPNMFTPMMFKQTNTKVTPYIALLTKINDNVPAAERDKYMAENGEYISYKKLSKEAKITLKDYKLIQYDITAGKQYSLKNKGFIK